MRSSLLMPDNNGTVVYYLMDALVSAQKEISLSDIWAIVTGEISIGTNERMAWKYGVSNGESICYFKD